VKAIRTDLLQPSASNSLTEQLWVYNGLDCCVTLEVLDAILPQLDNHTAPVYEFSRSLQAPVLEMNMRGLLVDEGRRQAVIKQYAKQIQQLQGQLWQIVKEGLGFDLNWRSPDQLKKLFYEVMGYAPIKRREKLRLTGTRLKNYNCNFSHDQSLVTFYLSETLPKKKASSELTLILMGECGLPLTSLELTPDASALHSVSLELGRISKILRTASEAYSSPTPDTSSPTSTSNKPSRAR
jgi:hypothetical protein